MSDAVAAVDLGATSGRVMIGRVDANHVSLESAARFPNGPVERAGGLFWEIDRLYSNVLGGLAEAQRIEPGIRSIGVDSWAVDYGILRAGSVVAPVFHYRDARNQPAAERVHLRVDRAALYAANGLQFLPFNTLYQLEAETELASAESFLLVPDLVNFWLTGSRFAERTNASTTGLLNVATHEWDDDLIARLGLPRGIFPELVDAGTVVGQTSPDVLPHALDVIAVGSHDTASAVVAVPSTRDDFAYVSCGTWGLVGVELAAPVLSEASRLANFTNEGGVDGRIRYLHNVMGLWLLSESVRTWEQDGEKIDLPSLLDAASAVSTSVPIFDANDDSFLPPGDMPARIAAWLVARGEPVPSGRAEFVRCIIESLADAFAHAVRRAVELSGKAVSVIHVVGGGSQNALLCQLTADRAGLPVVAGPVEATALGNVLVQARALGVVSGDLESLRAIVVVSTALTTYAPR